MAASTLYEAVEPHIVWKKLLAPIILELTGSGFDFEVCEPQLSVIHWF